MLGIKLSDEARFLCSQRVNELMILGEYGDRWDTPVVAYAEMSRSRKFSPENVGKHAILIPD